MYTRTHTHTHTQRMILSFRWCNETPRTSTNLRNHSRPTQCALSHGLLQCRTQGWAGSIQECWWKCIEQYLWWQHYARWYVFRAFCGNTCKSRLEKCEIRATVRAFAPKVWKPLKSARNYMKMSHEKRFFACLFEKYLFRIKQSRKSD